MIPTDTQVVDLMRRLYAPQMGDFDHVSDPEQDQGICWGLKHFDDVDVLLFRGSITKEDWFRNILSEMGRSFSVLGLGDLPYGFSMGLDAAMAVWKPMVKAPLIIGGHSLGGARAKESAGMAVQSYVDVKRIVTCGCPRAGTKILSDKIDGIPHNDYRNLDDPVWDVPTDPPWNLSRNLVSLSEPPNPGDISIFRDHHIELYLSGVAKYEAVNGNH